MVEDSVGVVRFRRCSAILSEAMMRCRGYCCGGDLVDTGRNVLLSFHEMSQKR